MSPTRRVPQLSLRSYTEGNSQDQILFVDQLMTGLKDYGFIVLKDHLVEQAKVDAAYDLLKKFYALPEETKFQYCGNNAGQRGYTPFKKEHAKDSKFGDLKEFWHVGRELAATSVYKGVYPENVWPTEIANFKTIMMDLYDSMDKTSVVLLEAIGKGLDLPSNYFKDMVHDGNSILRAIHYPPIVNQDTANSVRAAAHEDINLITLLVGATDSGLELLDRDGTWLPVHSNPGEIVVDTGDMMSRLTNEVLPATTHRVVNPKDSNTTRYSMPFFVHPHSNAVLSCIPSCKGNGAKFSDISAGDFLIQRLKEIGLYK
jgi:isopenicillin N synthase-like dioxygenase